jgi:hypothetical protein
VEWLWKLPVDDSAAESLARYDEDFDAEVKVLASAAFYARLKERTDGDGQEAALIQTLSATGPDMDERRQAAFAGLIALSRVQSAVEHKEDRGGHPSTSLFAAGFANYALARLVLDYWEGVRDAFGGQFADRLGLPGQSPWPVLAELCDSYPKATQDVLKALRSDRELMSQPSALQLLARTVPRSLELLEACLPALSSAGPYGVRNFVAADIIAEHFGGDPGVLGSITEKKPHWRHDEGVLVAMAEGWHESDEFKEAARLWDADHRGMSYPAFFALKSRIEPPDPLYRRLKEELDHRGDVYGRHLAAAARYLTRRLREDEVFRQLAEGRLLADPSAGERATVPRLLAGAIGLNERMRRWAADELERQESLPPEFGLDLVAGRTRAIAHSLLDTLARPARM